MKFLLAILFWGITVFSATLSAKEKYFVVERESESVAVIEDGLAKRHMENMHNMNHGVMKFDGEDAYLISRDGYIVKFNASTEKKEAEYKTSKSAIGFIIGKNYVAVANYDDKSVDILDRNLKPLQKIVTGSKNVGIKTYKDMLIFAQMDNDKVSIYKDKNFAKGMPHFEKFKEFNVGKMPFDAMIKDKTYIVGFFLTKGFGVIDLNRMSYKMIQVNQEANKPVLKIPHFGFWSISKKYVFIPEVGNNAVLVYDKNFKFIKAVKIQGLPVFTSLSPDQKHLAVTFSGKDFPTIQIIDTNTLKVIKTFKFKGRVLHVRWSKEYPDLYVSVNDANEVDVIDTKEWILEREIYQVKRPSGIFRYDNNSSKEK